MGMDSMIIMFSLPLGLKGVLFEKEWGGQFCFTVFNIMIMAHDIETLYILLALCELTTGDLWFPLTKGQ